MPPTVVPASEADLAPFDRRILSVARLLAPPGGIPNQSAVARELRANIKTVNQRIGLLRKAGLWPYRDSQTADYRPTPADFEAARAAACDGMGDGRGQVDDPREHGVLSVPRGGLDQGPPPTLAATVRGYVREWKVRTGRVVPKAMARATVPGNGLHGQAPAPYERTRHRHRSAWVSMDGKSRRIA